MKCLLCQQSIQQQITLSELFSWKPLYKQVVCSFCLTQPTCLTMCHQSLFDREDMRFIDVLVSYYREIFCSYKKYRLVIDNQSDKETIILQLFVKKLGIHFSKKEDAPLLVLMYDATNRTQMQQIKKKVHQFGVYFILRSGKSGEI